VAPKRAYYNPSQPLMDCKWTVNFHFLMRACERVQPLDRSVSRDSAEVWLSETAASGRQKFKKLRFQMIDNRPRWLAPTTNRFTCAAKARLVCYGSFPWREKETQG
jgi:hypothetical protein